MSSALLTLPAVERLARAGARWVHRTPLLRSSWLSAHCASEVFLKCENLQLTGSFKLRGALAALEALRPSERRAGVFSVSAGNHGAGLAFAARCYGSPCTVVVPSDCPRVKRSRIEAAGARVILAPHSGYDRALAWARERRAELGEHATDLSGHFVSAYDHPAVIAGGGGALALEILAALDDLDSLLIPCGGGGCAAGAAFVCAQRAPHVRVFAVNTDASPAMWRSLRDDRAHTECESEPTIADGLAGGVGSTSFGIARRFLAGALLAKEASLRSAVTEIEAHEGLRVEGSAAAGVAALLDGARPGKRMVVLLSGANIDPELASELGLGAPRFGPLARRGPRGEAGATRG